MARNSFRYFYFNQKSDRNQSIYHMCMLHVFITCIWHMCVSHVFVTYGYTMCLWHMFVTCVYYIGLSHVFVTCVWHMWQTHVLTEVFVTYIHCLDICVICMWSHFNWVFSILMTSDSRVNSNHTPQTTPCNLMTSDPSLTLTPTYTTLLFYDIRPTSQPPQLEHQKSYFHFVGCPFG